MVVFPFPNCSGNGWDMSTHQPTRDCEVAVTNQQVFVYCYPKKGIALLFPNKRENGSAMNQKMALLKGKRFVNLLFDWLIT